jgi:hypothetical protein
MGATYRLLTFSFMEQCTSLFLRSGTQRNHVEFISVFWFSEHGSLSSTTTSPKPRFFLTTSSLSLPPRPMVLTMDPGTSFSVSCVCHDPTLSWHLASLHDGCRWAPIPAVSLYACLLTWSGEQLVVAPAWGLNCLAKQFARVLSS